MKRLIIALCAIALSLLPALAQAPAGLNPANFVTNAATGADTASSAVQIGDATHFTYVCGITVSGLGATAATNVTVTVGPFTTTAGSQNSITFEYAFTGSATTINTPINVTFPVCLPTFGIATLTVPGAAGNTVTNLAIWGYKQ